MKRHRGLFRDVRQQAIEQCSPCFATRGHFVHGSGEMIAPLYSVRAGIGHRGSAGASPSQIIGRRSREGEALSEPAMAIAAQQELRPPKSSVDAVGRARLCPSRQWPSRLSRSFALPNHGSTQSGGRGSVRAGNGHRGSAGASPSQIIGRRSREGEAPSEPAMAIAAQQELRPPKSRQCSSWRPMGTAARSRPSAASNQ
jgi:hypothetical protein